MSDDCVVVAAVYVSSTRMLTYVLVLLLLQLFVGAIKIRSLTQILRLVAPAVLVQTARFDWDNNCFFIFSRLC